jgi:hypothetical protein
LSMELPGRLEGLRSRSLETPIQNHFPAVISTLVLLRRCYGQTASHRY